MPARSRAGYAPDYQFKAYAHGHSRRAATVCRFFSAAFAPKSSHFYTNMPYECDLAKTYPAWTFEGEVFNIPGAAAGRHLRARHRARVSALQQWPERRARTTGT